jgi:uncharacterized protein YgbK (DUF1537 family)
VDTKRNRDSATEREIASVVVVGRITPTTHEQLRALAWAERRSISKQLRVLIEDAVDGLDAAA